MPDPTREASRWLEQARRDLDDACFSSQGNRHHLACFLSQQAAEKALKAFLYGQGMAVVWGHSVDELCRQAATYDAEFETLRTRVGKLDRYYIPTRYPNGLPGGIPSESFHADDSSEAIELCRQTLDRVEKKLAHRE